MGVSSYFEFVTTLFGWVLYDRFWSVLSDSGVVLLPFIVIILTNVATSKKAGDDEGGAAKQSLKKNEVDLIMALVVLFLAGVPIMSVELGEMQYVRPTLDCNKAERIASGIDDAVINGAATGTSYDVTLSRMSNLEGRIPAWWGFLHTVTKSIVSASIAGIPCAPDLGSVSLRLESDPIEDKRVVKELHEFIEDCYRPSYSAFFRNDNTALTNAQEESLGYIGSTYFLNHPTEYYSRFYSTKARDAFPFTLPRDGGFESSAPAGHPSCREWWSDATDGVRVQVFNSIDPDVRDDLINRPQSVLRRITGTTLSAAEREEVLLRKYMSIQVSQTAGPGLGLATSYTPTFSENLSAGGADGFFEKAGNFVYATRDLMREGATSAIAGVGAAIKAPGHLAAGKAAREGTPIFLSIVLMMFVAFLPFLMVLSLYRLQTVMTLSVMFFAMHFFYVLWGIAFWVDNNLMEAITGDAGPFTMVMNPTQTLIIVWVQRFLYFVFPMLWLSMMTWVGFKGGSVLADQTQGLGSSAAAPMQAGAQAATNVATRGASSAIKAGGKK